MWRRPPHTPPALVTLTLTLTLTRNNNNWVVDTSGPNFVKRLTLAIRKRFDKEFSFLGDSHMAKKAPERYRPERFLLSHAPQLPDFHSGKTYEGLLADAEFFDAVDFINVQFYQP